MKEKIFLTGLILVALCGTTVTVMAQTPSPSAAMNRPTLRIGSEGREVTELQAALKLLGYYTGEVNGRYREQTVIAVSQFQRGADLTANGIVNTQTWNRLFPMTPPKVTASTPPNSPTPTATNTNNSAPSSNLPILREGMRGEAVTRLQQRLRELGTLPGAVDGIFGTATLNAVKAAQERFNLEPDGVVGPATWRVLLER